MDESVLCFDIYLEIANRINDGKTWKSWIFVCKNFRDMNSQIKVDKFSNHLLTLLKLYPDKNWDWYEISRNPNITWNIIKSNIDNPWSWYGVSMNTNITWDIVRDNPDKPWDWEGLSQNTNITSEIVLNNSDKPWDWYFFMWKPKYYL